jgi:class 3 adenylate cyclase
VRSEKAMLPLLISGIWVNRDQSLIAGKNMEAKHSPYNLRPRIRIIKMILKGEDLSYEDKEYIPNRDNLTFTNGFYVSCSALFVDMRGSKKLNDIHNKPVLAKIYKTYISEMIAVLKNHTKVTEIYIEGDCVWGIFNTPRQRDIDELLSVGAKALSIVDILNIEYRKRNYSTINVGIGISYGESLMIKSGYAGQGVNEVVWVGELVGEAAALCSYGAKEFYDKKIQVSKKFYDRLSEQNKVHFSKNPCRDCYHGDVFDNDMDEWFRQNG